MNDHFYISENISFRQVGNEVFLLHRDNNSVFNLNETASFIWNRIQTGTPLNQIVSELCNNFETDASTAADDVAELVQKLITAHIITPD
jgi:hypothetical protein